MNALSEVELGRVQAASKGVRTGDMVVHWQSEFGLVVIEVRAGQVFVNADQVEPVMDPADAERIGRVPN